MKKGDPINQTTLEISSLGPKSDARFNSTPWTLIMAARDGQGPSGIAALEQLCRQYWDPLYSFVRRTYPAYSSHDAEDFTQGFIAKLLKTKGLMGIDKGKGRFRTFLIRGLKNHIIDTWKSANRNKRGAGIETISSDEETFQDIYGHLWVDGTSPDSFFDACWATRLIKSGQAKIRSKYDLPKWNSWNEIAPYAFKNNREADVIKVAESIGITSNAFLLQLRLFERFHIYEALEPFLLKRVESGVYTDLAKRFDVSEGSLKTTLTRLKQEFRSILREDIARTVATAEDLEPEFRHLLNALTKPT